MRPMLQFLRDKGYKQTSLSAQRDNYAAHLYRKPGFEIVSEEEEEYIYNDDRQQRKAIGKKPEHAADCVFDQISQHKTACLTHHIQDQ